MTLQRTKPHLRRTFLKINALLFVFLFLSITFNKSYLRPQYDHIAFLGILLGCYPNFIAAYIVSLFPMALSLSQKESMRRILFYSTGTIVFLLMALEEIQPMWGASKVLDPFDILATGLGIILAVATFELLASHHPAV